MSNLLQVWIRVALAALLSMGTAFTASAHEVQPAVADVEIGGSVVTVTMRAALEPMIAGVNLSAVEDTDESPLSDRNDALRALSPEDLSAAFTEAWPALSEQIILRVGDAALLPTLLSVDVPPVGDVEIRRDSTVVFNARLPEGEEPVVLGLAPELGGLIIRQVSAGTDDAYEAYLTNGSLSDPMPRTGVAQITMAEVVTRYVVSGFDHIIPKGLDHILFVLGLFFYSLAFRPLLWQVSAFTVAHTVTLALATLGIVQPTMWIVEALIALSIVWVAVENIFHSGKKEIGWGRIAVVFGFGLLHGMGFASVLSEFGLGSHFIASLISFNIGVELGQLTVIAAAFILLALPFGKKPWFRTRIANPISVVIAVIAFYWVLNRIGWVGDIPYLA